MVFSPWRILLRGEEMKKEEEKTITWEAADPKLPVVQSGHLENRRQNRA